jgi:hypothetical protein
LTQPVFARAVDPGELPLIVADEGIAECNHLRRDEQVVAGTIEVLIPCLEEYRLVFAYDGRDAIQFGRSG